jgi:hypothetical protein
MSPLVRQRSRTASSWTVGMRTQTSSPARCNRASRRQSRRSVSGLVARRLGDQRRGDHLPAHVQAVQQPGQLQAGRSGLVAGSQAAGLPRRPTSLRIDASSWGIRSTSGTCWSAGKIPTEMVSLWTSRPRWIGVRCETLGTAGSFRMVAPPAPVWVTHADADRSRPFHAGYGSGGGRSLSWPGSGFMSGRMSLCCWRQSGTLLPDHRRREGVADDRPTTSDRGGCRHHRDRW